MIRRLTVLVLTYLLVAYLTYTFELAALVAVGEMWSR